MRIDNTINNNDVKFILKSKYQSLQSSKNTTPNVSALFQIITKKNKCTEERSPFELCIILDTSGSMEGKPLNLSKSAIKNILSNLISKDRVHLITYSNNANVIFKNGNIDNTKKLCEQIDSIEADGLTNMSSGIKLAEEIFHNSSNSSNKRIFLFSDGVVNIGITDLKKLKNMVMNLKKKKIVTSSFGIGDDYDEPLMSNLAISGNGNYFYIKNSEDIIPKVKKATNLLKTLYGNNGLLKIRGLNNFKIIKSYNSSVEADKNYIYSIPIGDICFDDLKQYLFKIKYCGLDLDFEKTDDNGKIKVAEYVFKFKELKSAKFKKVKGYLEMNINVSKNLKPDADVVIAEKIANISRNNATVLKLFNEGRRDEAILIKEENSKSLKRLKSCDNHGIVDAMLKLETNNLKNLRDKNYDKERFKKEVGEAKYRGIFFQKKMIT